MDHPTLLRHPVLAPHRLQGEEILPHAPEDYQVQQTAVDWWEVIEVGTGEVIYRGPGPVEVVQSRAPF